MTHTLRWKDTHVSYDAQSDPTVDDATLEDAKKSVEGLDDRYRPGSRPTVSLPGTNGTVAGNAFADMVGDDGELVDGESDSTDTKTADTDEKVTSHNDA